MSQLVVYVFTPALLVTKVAEALALERFWQWWPLPVFAVALVVQGCVLGALVGAALRLGRTQQRVVMAALAFKNNQSIPLALVPALAAAVPTLRIGPDDTPSDAASRAAGYVLFFTAIVSLLRWTIGAYLLRRPDASATADADADADASASTSTSASTTAMVAVEQTASADDDANGPCVGPGPNALGPRDDVPMVALAAADARGPVTYDDDDDDMAAVAPDSATQPLHRAGGPSNGNTLRSRTRDLWLRWRPKLRRGGWRPPCAGAAPRRAAPRHARSHAGSTPANSGATESGVTRGSEITSAGGDHAGPHHRPRASSATPLFWARGAAAPDRDRRPHQPRRLHRPLRSPHDGGATQQRPRPPGQRVPPRGPPLVRALFSRAIARAATRRVAATLRACH